MAALTRSLDESIGTINTLYITLAAGSRAFGGGTACIETAAGATRGQAKPAAASATLMPVGTFVCDVDATAGAKQCAIQLSREIPVLWRANAVAPNAVAAADVGSICYLLDDQTVTSEATGHSVAGRVWEVSPTRGVAVQFLYENVND